MTLSDILDQVLDECGFGRYSSYVGNSEANQLVALANRELYRLAKHSWSSLDDYWSISMTSDTTYPLYESSPRRSVRALIPDTAFTGCRQAEYPVVGEEWAYYQARGINSGLTIRVREVTSRESGFDHPVKSLEIQNPDPGETLHFRAVLNEAVEDSSGNRKIKFTDDTDLPLVPEELLTMGIIWRFKKSKGLSDWSSDAAEYQSMYKREKASDGGMRTVNMDSSTEGPSSPRLNLYVT